MTKTSRGFGKAIDMVEHWGTYAGDYFKEKHDLKGDIALLKALRGEEG